MTNIRVINGWDEGAATVDIEDMSVALAKQLVEALTVIKLVAGPHYSDVLKFREDLKAVIE